MSQKDLAAPSGQARAAGVSYAKLCKFHDVIVRGRRCEVTDHPDGRRTYFAWHEGCDKLREVPERETKLRADIDAALADAGVKR